MQLVDNDPEAMIRHLVRIEMYFYTLKQAIHEWGDLNGQYVSSNKSVKLQKRTRTDTKLDADKARAILLQGGVQLGSVADYDLTQDGIIAKLGQIAGKKVISELIQAKATKTYKNTYWRIQVK